MAVDPKKLLFSTAFNYQKFYESDSDTVTVAGLGGSATKTITHNLGYVPTVRVFYEPVSGQLWPLSRYQYDNSDGGPGTTLDITGDAYLTSTTLVIQLENNGSSSVDVPVYWRIYYDA